MVKHLTFSIALLPFICLAQTDSLTLAQAVQSALDNNKGVKAAAQHVSYQQYVKKASSEVPKTEVDFMYGQYNSILNDNSVSITQSIPFPTVFTSRSAYNDALVASSQARRHSVENELTYQVKVLCYQVYYLYGRRAILLQQDSLFNVLNNAISRRYQVGDGNKLEMTKTAARLREVKNSIHQVNADIEIAESNLQSLLNSPSTVHIKNSKNEILPLPALDSATADENPGVQIMKFQFEAADKLKRMERARALPDFKVGYFTQTLTGVQSVNGQDQYFGRDKRFNGFVVGVGIPLWFFPHASHVKAQDFSRRQAESELQQSKINWWAQIQKANQQAMKEKTSLEYYQKEALPMARLIQDQSVKSYRQGEISLTELLLNINQALTIQESYLKTILDYNQSILNIELLIGQKS